MSNKSGRRDYDFEQIRRKFESLDKVEPGAGDFDKAFETLANKATKAGVDLTNDVARQLADALGEVSSVKGDDLGHIGHRVVA